MASKNSSFAAGHGKADPLSINIPKPSGGNFIPARERGPRPELPHKTTEGAYGEYAPIALTPEQKEANDHVAKQQVHWDAHDALEAASKKEESLSPAAQALFGADSEGTLDDTPHQGPALKSIHAHLLEQHDIIKRHEDVAGKVVWTAGLKGSEYLQKADQLNLKHKAETAAGKVPNEKEVSQATEYGTIGTNLLAFKRKHTNNLSRNGSAVIKAHLDRAQTLLSQGKNADATMLLNEANSKVTAISKHLTSPQTKLAYEHADTFIPAPNPSEEASSPGMRRTGAEQGEAPKVTIGKAGRLKGDPGNLETVTADAEGLKYVQDKYGTKHPHTLKVKQAHLKWKRSRPSVPSTREVLLGTAGERPAQTDKPAFQAASAKTAATAKEVGWTPDGNKDLNVLLKEHFSKHAGAVRDAVKNGTAIPGESADVIGKENVQKIVQAYSQTQGKK
jgi:hypothetical protein